MIPTSPVWRSINRRRNGVLTHMWNVYGPRRYQNKNDGIRQTEKFKRTLRFAFVIVL
ncbi:hypothetical protein GA0061102_102936 [Rhizobium miluonense]|uniref:Uncharacterized protein n=1 Tax=Rhizobium miluonense TaxID=411945 RepID=A0A1C3WG82_9HYPH|nr:hypothetical protein GA0061102_102936 [Rhizobium miluonense]